MTKAGYTLAGIAAAVGYAWGLNVWVAVLAFWLGGAALALALSVAQHRVRSENRQRAAMSDPALLQDGQPNPQHR